MHVLGKVLLGFLIVFAIGAIFLTTMALDARTHWQQQVAQARQDYETRAEELRIKKSQHRELQEELDRVRRGWGDLWGAPNSRPISETQVSIGAGTQNGLGANAQADSPVVHLFNVTGPEQQSEYIGAFRIDSAQPGSTTATLNYEPDPNLMIPPGTWRVREEIPFDYATRFIDLRTKQREALARLQRMNYDITRLQDQLAASQNLLQERVNQLQGDPNLQDASPLQQAGFVQSIRDRTTERDQLLQRLHNLRLERRLKLESLETLFQENLARAAQYRQMTEQSAAQATPSTAEAAPPDVRN
jgi:hypothetical protein